MFESKIDTQWKGVSMTNIQSDKERKSKLETLGRGLKKPYK